MPEHGLRIVASPITQETWAPFGWLPVADTDAADGTHQLSFVWADPHVNIIGHSLDEVVWTPGRLRCDVLFRHRTHTQVLMPLDHRCVVAVAPPDASFGESEGADAVRAFALEPLQSIVLSRGTWHWGPYPDGADHVRLFNVQGLRYREDNESVDLAALGQSVEVLTAPE